MEAALRFTDVTRRFGSRVAVSSLSLEVPRGSLFGLIGPNGAGKTTAFSLACGFLRPHAGEVTLLGERGFDPHRLKGRVAAMPQDATLGRETRCLEHLLFFGQLQGMSAPEARRDAERVLEAVGLADRRDARVRTLSHGMVRRLAVAQALLGRPELILLDEPTSGLDPRHAHELRMVLRQARDGRTILISSHNLPELESLCDHVAFIDHGRLMAAGPIDAVTGKGESVEIDLAAGPVPTEAVASAVGDAEIRWDEGARTLFLRFQPTPDRGAEDVICLALRALLDGGARVSGVRRGTSLERTFLQMQDGTPGAAPR